jgi:hypothetical protein
VLTYLKTFTEGKRLSYGKLPGYSELTPYYGIQAEGATVASVLLTPSGGGTDFGFNYWMLESIEISLTGKVILYQYLQV